MINVGLDVHVRNSYLHARDAAGAVLAKGRAANTLMDLAAGLRPVEAAARAAGEGVRVVLESTTNSRPVALLLERWGAEAGIDLTAEVLDARKLAVIARSVCKCDKLDAAVLAELAGSNLRLPVCHLPDEEVFALREHLRARADLVRLRTMLKNRCHALLHRRGILRPAGLDLFTRAGRAYLDGLELDPAGRAVLTRFLELLGQVNLQVRASAASLREEVRRPRWARPAALLQSMPGVGLITALTILAELGDPGRFKSRDAVANFAGLVPVVRSSNQSTWRGGITRRGSCHLRGAVVEAAWTAKGKAPAYEALFERVRRRGGPQKAIVAVARRMLEDAWVMLRRGEAFRYAAPARDGGPEPSAPGRAGATTPPAAG